MTGGCSTWRPSCRASYGVHCTSWLTLTLTLTLTLILTPILTLILTQP